VHEGDLDKLDARAFSPSLRSAPGSEPEIALISAKRACSALESRLRMAEH
jgi:hypothetical protein